MKKVYVKNLIFSGLFLFISGVGFLFLYRSIDTNHNLSKKLSNDYKTEESRRIEIQSLNKAISEIDEEIALLDSHFIKENQKDEEITLFLTSLEELANAVDSKTEVVSVEIPNEKSKEFFISLRTEGSFNSIYKFLLLMENSKYELDVVSMRLLKESNGENLEKKELPKWRAYFKIKIISFLAN